MSAGASGTADDSADKSAAEIKAMSEKLVAAQKEAAEHKAKIDKWEKDQKDAKDKDRLAKGDQERMLAEQKAELDAKKAALEVFEKSTQDRAERLLDKLSDESKAKVEKYKDKLSLSDWATMVEEEVEAMDGAGGKTVDEGTRIPGGTPSAGGKRRTGGRELLPKTETILEQLGVNPEHGRQLRATEKTGGNVHFSTTIAAMIAGMKRVAKGGRPWTPEEAERGRKGG